MTDFQQQISERISLFIDEIAQLARQAAIDTLAAALGDDVADAPSNGRAKGEKRTPEEIAAVESTLLAAIAAVPGQRIEQIGKSLGIPTKELVLPVKKLLGAGAIYTKGEKRSTTYFPKAAKKRAKS